MKCKFADANHENMFHLYCSKYRFDHDNPEYFLLFYLLSASVGKNNIDDVISYKDGSVSIKTDALHHPWCTGSQRKIIRLAFNLFNDYAPTIYAPGLSLEEKLDEMAKYRPTCLFSGLDSRLCDVAFEALKMYVYWNNYQIVF